MRLFRSFHSASSHNRNNPKPATMDRGRRAMPVQNKACNQRYIKKCQERHRQKVRKSAKYISICLFRCRYHNIISQFYKLRDMKCSIDNKSPRQATHLRTKAKKNALMEERIDQIETENRLLLEKMSHIMKVGDSCYL